MVYVVIIFTYYLNDVFFGMICKIFKPTNREKLCLSFEQQTESNIMKPKFFEDILTPHVRWKCLIKSVNAKHSFFNASIPFRSTLSLFLLSPIQWAVEWVNWYRKTCGMRNRLCACVERSIKNARGYARFPLWSMRGKHTHIHATHETCRVSWRCRVPVTGFPELLSVDYTIKTAFVARSFFFCLASLHAREKYREVNSVIKRVHERGIKGEEGKGILHAGIWELEKGNDGKKTRNASFQSLSVAS